MRRAYLHIGHAKTGSTALQFAFNSSRQTLADHGIQYPAETDNVGRIDLARYNPGGNAMISRGESFADGLGRIMSSNRIDPDRHLLLSGELIYHRLETADILPDMRDILGSFGFDDIRLLLFVRDPIPHHVSGWQQQLRSRGATDDIPARPAGIGGWLRNMAAALETAMAADGITLKVHSYDRPGVPLIDLVEQWLELPGGTLDRPPQRPTNRSFTRSEAKLALAVNRALGKRNELGQRFVHLVPDPAPDPLGLPLGVQDGLAEALAEPLDAVNAQLPDHARLRLTRVPEVDWEAPAVFNAAQIDVIAQFLSEVATPKPAAPTPRPARPKARRRPTPLWRKALRPFDLRRWL